MKFLKRIREVLNSKEVKIKERTYILDTCALHSSEAMQIIEEASKVILLTGTIKELDAHKNDGGSFGENIKKVCRESRMDENSEKYECIAGYEKQENRYKESGKYECINGYVKYKYQDDNIIDYCKSHRNVIILTCDNNLCNTAKAYNIPYVFPKRDEEEKAVAVNNTNIVKKKVATDNANVEKEKLKEKRKFQRVNIKGVEIEDDNLYITNGNLNKFNLVIRNGISINANSAKKIKLEVGDHIFRMKKKNENVIIVEYKIVEVTPSMYAIEIRSAKEELKTIESLTTNKFPKEVKKKAESLLRGEKEEKKDKTKTVEKSGEQEIILEKRWIRVQNSNNYANYINVERNGKLIKTQDYAAGDLLYLSKYNKKKNNLEINVYRIVNKNNRYVAEKSDEYKLWLVNEIYSIKLSEELQDEIRSFFVRYARY